MSRSSISGTLTIAAALVSGWAVYHYGLISEDWAGRALLVGILLAALGVSLWPRWLHAAAPRGRAGLLAFATLWGFAVGYAPLRIAFPTAPVASTELPTADGALATTLEVPMGPCELVVSGHLASELATHAIYQLDAGAPGEAPASLTGRFERVYYRARGRRRLVNGVQTVERTENAHRLERGCGSELELHLRKLPSDLSGPLTVEVHRAGLGRELLIGLGVLAFVIALWIDRRKVADGVPVAYAVAVTLVFSFDFSAEATPHRLVSPTVGALMFALILGVPVAWLLSRLVHRHPPRAMDET